MKHLLTVTAFIELGAGLALLCIPSAAVNLILGSTLESSAAVALGRVAGAALLALSVANGIASRDALSVAARGVIAGMTVYNIGAVVILGAAGIWSRPVGIALWPAAVLHVVMSVWCIVHLMRRPSAVGQKLK